MKKLIPIILFLFLLLPLLFSNVHAQNPFAGGSGTENDPYQISTVEQLQEIRNHTDRHFIQIADIDAGETEEWNDGKGFDPIGWKSLSPSGDKDPFTGSYNGNGFEISGLTINREDQSNVGLFGVIENALITNIQLVHVHVSGDSQVGGLAGYNDGGQIYDSHVTGDVSGNNRVGGLVGNSERSRISGSHASCEVSGNGHVGGLVGNNEGRISDSHATGDVSGYYRVGGLAGVNEREKIINSHAHGMVTGQGNAVGGLVGFNAIHSDGEIRNSHATGVVSGMRGIGGLVGFNGSQFADGLISGSHASGDVSGEDSRVGGLVGINRASRIENSYAHGMVTGNNEVGGLVGGNYDDGIITASYAIGMVTGSEKTGGFLGWNDESEITSNYWNTESTGQNEGTGSGDPDGVTGLATSQMTGTDAYEYMSAFDFRDTWFLTEDYPALYWEDVDALPPPDFEELEMVEPVSPEDGAVDRDITPELVWKEVENAFVTYQVQIALDEHFDSPVMDKQDLKDTTYLVSIDEALQLNTNYFWRVRAVSPFDEGEWSPPWTFHTIQNPFAGGSGTKSHPFHVETLEQLQYIQHHKNKYFIQITDIDASETLNWNEGEGFEPIGWWNDDDNNEPFIGFYDGNGHTISNLHIDRKDESVGLFGYMVEATLVHVALENVNVSGDSRLKGTGALVGWNMGSITNSHVTGKVSGTFYTGGLVGRNNGKIAGSFTTADVFGETMTGGLVGFKGGGEIKDSYSSGEITGYNYVGGLIGYVSSSDVKISDSHATGAVSGQRHTGGLLGRLSGELINSYAEGVVSGSIITAGGLVGTNYGTINGSYATGSVSGGNQTGGLVGENIRDIMGSYATGNVSGADFTGGLVGITSISRGEITDSYAEGTVTGRNFVGGLVGQHKTHRISGSHATGEVSGDSIVGGLVGSVRGTISASFSSGKVTGKNSIGGLAGENGRNIISSYATGDVSGVDYVGGLVGRNQLLYPGAGSVSSSYAGGTVSGSRFVGGLVGWNRGTVNGSHALGEVTGDSIVGGLVGWSRSTIMESYSSGKVSGENGVGGLVGHHILLGKLTHSYSHSAVEGVNEIGGLVGVNRDDALIEQTYSVGQVTGNEKVGGLIGVNEGTTVATYWDTETSNQSVGVGSGSSDGITGLVTGEMTALAAYDNMDELDYGVRSNDHEWNRIWLLTEAYPALHWEDVTAIIPPPKRVYLFEPKNEQVDIPIPATLKWTSGEWAETYQFQLSEDDAFTSPIMDSTVAFKELVIEHPLEYGTTYFWKVRSVNDSGYSEWSDPFQFQTMLATLSGKSELPHSYELDQNYPNPFNPATKIQFALPEPSHVRLDVYNALGQRVATLINENKSPGRYEVTFDAASLSSGLYLYRIQTEGFVETRSMLLVK